MRGHLERLLCVCVCARERSSWNRCCLRSYSKLLLYCLYFTVIINKTISMTSPNIVTATLLMHSPLDYIQVFNSRVWFISFWIRCDAIAIQQKIVFKYFLRLVFSWFVFKVGLKLRYYYFYLFPDTDVWLCFAWQGKFSIKCGLMFSQYLASFWSLAWALFPVGEGLGMSNINDRCQFHINIPKRNWNYYFCFFCFSFSIDFFFLKILFFLFPEKKSSLSNFKLPLRRM